MIKIDSNFLFNVYAIISSLTIIIYGILKCYFNINVSEKAKEEEDDKPKYMNKSLLLHMATFFIFGLLFTFSNANEMILKIIVFELLLIIIKYCDIYKGFTLDNMKDLSFTVFIDSVSFLLGCLCIYYWDILKVNKEFMR